MIEKDKSRDDNKAQNNNSTDNEEHDEITEQIGFLKNHNQKYMRLFQKHLLEEIKFINFFEFLVQKKLGVILEKNEFLKLYIFYGQKNLPSMPYTPLFFTCRTIIKIEVLRDVNTNQIIYSSRSFFLETLITLKEYKIKNESAYIVIETTDESSTIKKRLKMDMLHKISPMSHINAYVISNKGKEIVYHKGNIYQRSASDIKNVISDIRNDFLNIILPQYHLFDLFDNYKLDKEKKKNVIELKEYLEDLKKRMFDMQKRLNDIIITKSTFLKNESELNMKLFETSAIDYVNNNSNFEVFSTYIINDFMLNKKRINVLNYDSNLFFKNNFMYFNFLHNYLKEKKDEHVLNVYIYLKDPLIQEYELNYFNYYVVLDLYILDVIIKNVDLLIEKKGKKRKNVNHILVCIDNYVVKYNVLSSNIYLDIQQDIKSFFHESNRNVDGSKIQDMLFHFERKNNSIYQNNMFHDKYYKKKIKKDIKEEKKQNDSLQKYNKNIDPLLFIRKKNILFDSQKEYYKKFLSSYTYEEIVNILCNKSSRCNNRIFQLINDVNKNTFILKSHLALKNELKKFFQINQNKLLKNKTGVGLINSTKDDINRITNMNLATNTNNAMGNITNDSNIINTNNNNNTSDINNNNTSDINNNNTNNINNNNTNNINNNNTNNINNNNTNNINNNTNNINNNTNNINNNTNNTNNNSNNNNNNNIFNNEDSLNKCSAYTYPFSNDAEKNYQENRNQSFSNSDHCFKLLNSIQGANKSSDFINMQNIDDYLNTYYVAYHESFKVVKKEHYYSIISHIFESYLNIDESSNDDDHPIHKKYPHLKGRNVSINFLGQLPEIMKTKGKIIMIMMKRMIVEKTDK
ncbi:hypothetical protein PFFCH_00255 [Plasmodium falciparum FCH/4]|uniref:Uncharacterized protein n=1 Tax=Plasmodium falciparum FCH/4 TaxID=1036724 RepID=A0A024VU63_PLAFA|nr:hypothetical protein PFFCH_00255 [Plasmodium falciparum FCH/4]